MDSMRFTFHTGIKRRLFSNVRLRGSWDANGLASAVWTEHTMSEAKGSDGCPIFEASVSLPAPAAPVVYHWGVVVDTPECKDLWGIMDEVPDMHSAERYRNFVLDAGFTGGGQDYYFSSCRRRMMFFALR